MTAIHNCSTMIIHDSTVINEERRKLAKSSKSSSLRASILLCIRLLTNKTLCMYAFRKYTILLKEHVYITFQKLRNVIILLFLSITLFL